MGGGVRDPNRIVDDFFRTTDVPPRFAPELTFGQPVVMASDFNGCCGYSQGPGADPRQYTSYQCGACANAMAAATYTAALDWRWNQTTRRYLNGNPVTDQDACGGNRAACGYDQPWRGSIVFDLQGPANRVVIFPITDHVTDNCLEAFEYSVYLTDDPASRELVADGAPPDPARWNRAVLQRAYLRGWTNNYLSTGTAADMALHPLDMFAGTPNEAIADSITTVWSLPCGVNFRYAAVLPGNYGNPDARCAFHSAEDEFDAVAGLNEDGTAICPDRDNDGFRDAMCGGTDCDDNDRAVNPGATEDCRSMRDVNCDRRLPTCPAGLGCFDGVCVPGCIEGACAAEFTCRSGGVPMGQYCVPSRCGGMACPPGQVCGPTGCQPPCEGAVCPANQTCIGGACVDVCSGIACPGNQHCERGRCVPSCTCLPCTGGANCNADTGRCEAPGCGMLPCPVEQRDCSGEAPRCRMSFCDGVVCPVGQLCDELARACVIDRCNGISCPGGFVCRNGECVVMERPDSGVLLDTGVPAADSATVMDSGVRTMDASAREVGTVDPGTEMGGCGCRTNSTPHGRAHALWLVAAAVTAMLRRRTART